MPRLRLIHEIVSIVDQKVLSKAFSIDKIGNGNCMHKRSVLQKGFVVHAIIDDVSKRKENINDKKV